MARMKTTQLVKGSASQKRAAEMKTKKEKTGSAVPRKGKLRLPASSHKQQKLNTWSEKEMEEAVLLYHQSREPGYHGKPVSDKVCRQIHFECVLSFV